MNEVIKVGNVLKSVKSSQPEYVKITKIDKSLSRWVGVEKISDGTLESVQKSDLRFVETTKDHLDKLGFNREEINGLVFYTKGKIWISGFYTEQFLPNNGKLIVMSGFRLVNNLNPWQRLNKYFVNNEFDSVNFNKDFMELNELNTLYDFLKEKDVAIPDIQTILEPLY